MNIRNPRMTRARQFTALEQEIKTQRGHALQQVDDLQAGISAAVLGVAASRHYKALHRNRDCVDA
jgi:hypothetical protein